MSRERAKERTPDWKGRERERKVCVKEDIHISLFALLCHLTPSQHSGLICSLWRDNFLKVNCPIVHGTVSPTAPCKGKGCF